MKFEKKNLTKSILLKYYENIHNTSQGPMHPGLMQEKVQKGDFQKKKTLMRLQSFFLFILGSYDSLEGLER